MPQLKTEAQAIWNQLAADVRTACAEAAMEISAGFPRKEVTTLPSGTIMLMEMASDFAQQDASAVELGTALEFGIEIRLPMPADEDDPGLWTKFDILDDFTDLVETSNGLYAGYGMWPRISKAALNLDDNSEEEQLTMQLQVSMVVTKRYGT
jgi:hypothetical protein